MALGQFLIDNGILLTASDDDATDIMLRVAQGQVTIQRLTEWLRPRSAVLFQAR